MLPAWTPPPPRPPHRVPRKPQPGQDWWRPRECSRTTFRPHSDVRCGMGGLWGGVPHPRRRLLCRRRKEGLTLYSHSPGGARAVPALRARAPRGNGRLGVDAPPGPRMSGFHPDSVYPATRQGFPVHSVEPRQPLALPPTRPADTFPADGGSLLSASGKQPRKPRTTDPCRQRSRGLGGPPGSEARMLVQDKKAVRGAPHAPQVPTRRDV